MSICVRNMDDTITLIVTSVLMRSITIRIHKTASVEDLMNQIRDWNEIDLESQGIIYAGKYLVMTKNGKKMYLSDYNLKEKSVVFAISKLARFEEASQEYSVETPEKPRLKQLDGDIERSSSPDMITWDDDPNNQRSKMPCGHVIGPESLTEYCRSLMAAGKWQFRCPYKDMDTSEYCGQIWDYSIVKRHGVLTEDEMKDFENTTSKNYMHRAAGIQECPQCQVFCMRQNSKERRIVCLSCKKDGKTYEFCWSCLGDWNSPGTSNCGNDACTGEDPRLKILKETELKEIVKLQGCPSTRACPKCGLLIEHTKDCKHMVCVCGQKFCFICLTKPGADGNYRCGAYNSHCTIAPIQEKIGNMNGDNEETSVVTEDETADDDSERTSESNATQNAHSILVHSTVREELERNDSIRMIERGNVEEETNEFVQNTSDITIQDQPHRSDRDDPDANSESRSTRSGCTIL